MNKNLKRIILAFMLVVLPFAMAGCDEKDYSYVAVDPGQLQAPSVDRNSAEYRKKYKEIERYDETVTLDVAVVNYPLEAGVKTGTLPTNQTFNQLAEEYLNIKLNYVVMAKTSNYESDLNLYIADKGLPDMFYVTNSAMYTELANDGMLADLSDAFWYLNDNLQQNYLEYFPELLPTCMQEDKLYALPNITNQYAAAQRLYIRQDWIDVVNVERAKAGEAPLSTPKTMEEMYTLGEAFVTYKDAIAAATGIKSNRVIPFGMTKELTWSGSYSVEGFLNCYGTSINAYFEGEDGQLYYSNTSPEMKSALTMLRDMYSAGILDKDFATKTSDMVQANIKSGYVGMAFGEWWMAKDVLDDCIERVPGSEWTWVDLPAPAGQTAQPIVKTVNVDGYNLVSKDCKHPEAVARLINLFYDIYYSDDAQARYGDRVLPSNGFYYQFVPIKLWDGMASINEYKRVQQVFDNLYEAGFVNLSQYVPAAEYEKDGILQKVKTTTSEDYVVSVIDGDSYIIHRNIIAAINANSTWKAEFDKLHRREKTLHFVDGYPYFVAYKDGKKLSEMCEGEKGGWGIYHEMVDPKGGYAYVVDLTEKKIPAKYNRFYGANLSAMTDKLPYITTQTGTLFAQMIVGELSIDKFESDYVQAVVNNNGGDIVIKQVNEWYKANKIDYNNVYALVK